MRKDLRKVVEALEDQGFEVRLSSKGHLEIYQDGRRIATLAGTPSDRRSWLNSLAPLRRAGFRWPR